MAPRHHGVAGGAQPRVVLGWQDSALGHGVLCTNVLAQPAARQRGMRRGKAGREVAPGAPQLSALTRLLTRSFPAHPPFFFLRLDPPPSLSTTRGQICINSTAAASINWAALGALLLGEPEVIPLPWREHPELDISGSNGKRSHSTPQSSEPGTNPLRRAELGRATAHTSSCWMLLRHDTL